MPSRNWNSSVMTGCTQWTNPGWTRQRSQGERWRLQRTTRKPTKQRHSSTLQSTGDILLFVIVIYLTFNTNKLGRVLFVLVFFPSCPCSSLILFLCVKKAYLVISRLVLAVYMFNFNTNVKETVGNRKKLTECNLYL